MRKIIFLVIAIATVACGVLVAQDTYRNESQMGTVYIYRPDLGYGSAITPTVILEKRDLVNMVNGTTYRGHFPPGRYVFRMDDDKSGAQLDVKAGETYYFKIGVVPGFWKAGGEMTLVAPEQGAYEIKGIHAATWNAVEDHSFESNEDRALYSVDALRALAFGVLQTWPGKMPKFRDVHDIASQLRATMVIDHEADAWGTPFRAKLSDDRKTLLLVSAGADGTFDESTWGTNNNALESLGDDVVVTVAGERALFTRSWRK